jgi:hypothetical protein
MLVDMLGSAAILTVGAPHTRVSMEINVSYLNRACLEYLREWNRKYHCQFVSFGNGMNMHLGLINGRIDPIN